MGEKIGSVNKSTMDLIIDRFLANLEKHPEFDDETVKKLSEIASSGNLNKPTIVEKAIKSQRVEEK